MTGLYHNSSPADPHTGELADEDRLRVVFYNPMDYGDLDHPDPARWRRVEDVLAETKAHVIGVCEVMGGAQPGPTFAHLVHSVSWKMLGHGGLSCLVPSAEPQLHVVFQPGRPGRGVGLMWNSHRVVPVPDSLRRFDKDPLSTGMAVAEFLVDDVRLTLGVTHLPPRWPEYQKPKLRYIAGEVVKPGRPGAVLLDWNHVLASRTDDCEYYDPDPYVNRPWRHEYTCLARRDPGTGNGIARRDATEEIEEWGLHDPAAHTNAAHYVTAGHWRDDALPLRCAGPLATREVADATEAIWSVHNDNTHKASDHTPVVWDLNTRKLRHMRGLRDGA